MTASLYILDSESLLFFDKRKAVVGLLLATDLFFPKISSTFSVYECVILLCKKYAATQKNIKENHKCSLAIESTDIGINQILFLLFL